VRLAPEPGNVFVERGKSKYARRSVPLTDRARAILSSMQATATSVWVFAAADGSRLTRHWPSEQFRPVRDALKLPRDCVVHSCRHTFCTRLGEHCDAFTLQTLAGHSSVVISQRYVHPDVPRREAAIARLNA